MRECWLSSEQIISFITNPGLWFVLCLVLVQFSWDFLLQGWEWMNIYWWRKKKGTVSPVSFKICCCHLLGLQVMVVLPHQKLFMNQGARSWRHRFLVHCLTHYQQSLGNLCWLLLLRLHCQKPKESSSHQDCRISLNLSVFSFFLEVFILRKAAAGYLFIVWLGHCEKGSWKILVPLTWKQNCI